MSANQPEFDAFVECWNDSRFFDAHEVLEGLWMRTRDECQRGLIQLAAALYHIQRHNLKGARTMCDRSIPRLRRPSDHPSPVDSAMMAEFAVRVRRDLTETNGQELIDARPKL